LQADPDRATELAAWQRDAEQLRAGLSEEVDDNPRLDPARIRTQMRDRRRSRAMMAAALVACMAFGAIAGWQLRASRDFVMPPPMSDAVQAYRMFSPEDALKPDLKTHDPAALQAWIDQKFPSAPHVPDLATSGFHPVGVRLLALLDGPGAMVLYRDEQGSAISFYIRPRVPLPRGERHDRDLLAQFGSGEHYSIAMISHDGRDAAIARQAIAGAF
ncbi:MAG TPA: hypothetical protein VIV58_33955, partial [Kofleriaceae bacterium]